MKAGAEGRRASRLSAFEAECGISTLVVWPGPGARASRPSNSHLGCHRRISKKRLVPSGNRLLPQVVRPSVRALNLQRLAKRAILSVTAGAGALSMVETQEPLAWAAQLWARAGGLGAEGLKL